MKNSIKNSINSPIKVLLTDAFFPSVYCKWRLVEIHSFIEKYKADICVLSCDKNIFNIQQEFNYEELCDDFHLKDYNILIFNPEFNYINKYNTAFDGTYYNNKLLGIDYLFSANTSNNYQFNIYDYDVFYHIFLSAHKTFNNIVPKVPLNKQYLHLYPGGGFIENVDTDMMKYFKNKVVRTNIIYTQKFIEPYLIAKPKCRKCYVFGAPLCYKDEPLVPKRGLINCSNLCVAFASVGNPIAKGLGDFLKIVHIAQQLKLPITFITIGNCDINILQHKSELISTNMPIEDMLSVHKSITHYSVMPQDVLDCFYYKNVDVYLNLEKVNINSKNGWTLGGEAALQGCVLLTKDNYNQNAANNYIIDEYFVIDDNHHKTVDKLKQLLDNKWFLSKSTEIQTTIYNLCKYDIVMTKVFDFIETK
jgi:hypothetical protein